MAPQPFLAMITPLTGGEPGVPTHPIALPPGVPAHPIAGPPLGTWGPNDPRPVQPIYWPRPADPSAEHPIVIPPDPPPDPPPTGPVPLMEWYSVWTEEYGWAVIGVPIGPTPTPSARRR